MVHRLNQRDEQHWAVQKGTLAVHRSRTELDPPLGRSGRRQPRNARSCRGDAGQRPAREGSSATSSSLAVSYFASALALRLALVVPVGLASLCASAAGAFWSMFRTSAWPVTTTRRPSALSAWASASELGPLGPGFAGAKTSCCGGRPSPAALVLSQGPLRIGGGELFLADGALRPAIAVLARRPPPEAATRHEEESSVVL